MKDTSFVPLVGALEFLRAIVEACGLPFDEEVARTRIPLPATPACLFAYLEECGIEAVPIAPRALRCLRGPLLLARVERNARARIDEGSAPPELSLVRLGEGMALDDDSTIRGSLYWKISRENAGRSLLRADQDDAPEPLPFGFASLLRTLASHRGLWRDVLIASFAIQLTALFVPLMTQVIFDKVVAHDATSTLNAVGVALVVFALFGAAMNWSRQTLMMHLSNRVDLDLGQRVFAHLLKLPAQLLEHRSTGNTVSRLAGLETIRGFISGAALTLLLDIPFLLMFVAVMLHYSVGLTLLALGFTVAIAIVTAAVTPLLRARLDEQFKASARSQAFTTEHIAAFATIKAMQMEPLTSGRHRELLESRIIAARRAGEVGIVSGSATQLLEQAMGHAVLIGGVLLVMRNDGFSIGMLIAFQMFSSRLGQPVTRLAGLWGQYQEARIAVARLADLMNAPAEPYAALPRALTGPAAGCVQLEAVGFRYSESRPFLFRNLSLQLRPGTTTVLVGRSGSGKSTLAKLLLGSLRCTEGRILVDGCDARSMAANELRAHYGVVPQEVVLFSGSVYDNVRGGRPSATAEEIETACRQAGIHDTVLALDQGYQTPLGENGVGLSGGQRQRIAIARALLRRPRVLIFDEATSGLDDASADAIAATINVLKADCAVVFIAHRIPRPLKVDVLCRVGTPADAERPRNPSLPAGVRAGDAGADPLRSLQ